MLSNQAVYSFEVEHFTCNMRIRNYKYYVSYSFVYIAESH